MHTRFIFFLFYSFLFLSCDQNSSNNSSEVGYSDQFKRYCLVIKFNSETKEEAQEFLKSPGWRKIKELFKDEGVRSFTTFSASNYTFIIMDTSMDFVYKDAMTQISKKESYKSFVAVNEGEGLRLINKIYDLSESDEGSKIEGYIKSAPLAYDRMVLMETLDEDPSILKDFDKFYENKNNFEAINSNRKKAGILELETYRFNNQVFHIFDVESKFIGIDDFLKGSELEINLKKELEKYQKIDQNTDIVIGYEVMKRIN